MKSLVLAFFAILATPAFSEVKQYTGVLVNPVTGYVGPIVVVGEAKVELRHLAACGANCEFTDFIWPGQCMVVSISRRNRAYGYYFGPSDDLANSRSQAHRYCQRNGGTACKEYPPICP